MGRCDKVFEKTKPISPSLAGNPKHKALNPKHAELQNKANLKKDNMGINPVHTEGYGIFDPGRVKENKANLFVDAG